MLSVGLQVILLIYLMRYYNYHKSILLFYLYYGHGLVWHNHLIPHHGILDRLIPLVYYRIFYLYWIFLSFYLYRYCMMAYAGWYVFRVGLLYRIYG